LAITTIIMKKLLYNICILMFIANTAISQKNKLQTLQWLTGTWVMHMKNGAAYEIWEHVNDSTYQSHSYIIKTSGDTVIQESVKLVYRDGKMLYIPTVPGQNNNQPVPFIITQLTENGFVAENPEHDFPQKIVYLLKSTVHLYASIEGVYKNKFSKEEYNMEKK